MVHQNGHSPLGPEPGEGGLQGEVGPGVHDADTDQPDSLAHTSASLLQMSHNQAANGLTKWLSKTNVKGELQNRQYEQKQF